MGTLYVVATPIGNLNDITFRALEILKNVDIIACEDTRQTLKLLNHYEIKNKLVAYHKFNEKEKTGSLINDLNKGLNIAIVTDAGTPCISDPGYILIKEAHENNIEVIGIPGASAVVTSLSVSGLDTSQFSFIGFLPVDNTKFKEEIDKMLKSSINTFVIYESPKRIVKLFSKLVDYFPNSNIYIASDLTKIHERGFFGKIETIYEQIKNDSNIEKGEYAIVLQKNNIVEEVKETISLEAKIVDEMVKNNCTIKDAIELINNKDINIKKNDLKEASLNLKKLFDK